MKDSPVFLGPGAKLSFKIGGNKLGQTLFRGFLPVFLGIPVAAQVRPKMQKRHRIYPYLRA